MRRCGPVAVARSGSAASCDVDHGHHLLIHGVVSSKNGLSANGERVRGGSPSGTAFKPAPSP